MSQTLAQDGEGKHLNPHRHLIITVHGIRTFGQWQQRLARLVCSSKPSVEVHNYHYGYFSVVAFVIPIFRWLATRRFRRDFLEVASGTQWDRIDIVAHSFGTYLVAWGLRRIPPEKQSAIHTVIFAGSVLRYRFPWHEVMSNTKIRVINDCGIRDSVLVLSQLFVLFSGMAGRMGFHGMTGKAITNRYFNFGHSGYFLKDGALNDDFMRDKWVPLLTGENPPNDFDEREIPTVLQGVRIWLLNIAEPIKLAACLIVLWFTADWFLDQRETAVREARIAKSHQLAAEALAERSGRLDRALLLSLAALRFDNNVNTRRSILKVLQYPARRFTTLWGGLGAINDVAFSPDGELLIAAGPDGDLMRWTVSEPSALGVRLSGHAGAVKHVTFAREARLAASTGADNNVVIWDFARDAPTRKALVIKEPNLMRAVLSPDGRRLATIHHDKTITLLDVDSEETIASKTLTDVAKEPFNALAYSPNGRLLATGSGSGRVRIWNAMDLVPYGDVLDLGLYLNTVAFGPNGSVLAIGMGSGTIQLWAISAGVQKPKLLQGHGADVTSLSFSADGKVLASASRDHTIRLWDVSAGVALAGFEPLEHRGVTSVALDRSGRWLASGSSEGDLRLWDLSTRTGIGEVLPYGPNRVAALAVSAGGNTLAAADLTGRLSLWNVPELTPKSPLIKVHDSRALLLYFSKDDREIISSDRYSEICVTQVLLEKKSCRSIKELVGDGGAIFPSPDGSVLASRSKERIVRLWDAQSLRPMAEPFLERVNPTTELSFSSDSQMLGAVCGIASTAMCLWTIGSTPTPLKVPVGAPGIANLAFSWDRKIVAAGGWDNLVSLWDLTSTANRREPFRGHIGPVLKVLFSPDGRILSSAADRDYLIRLWDVDRSGIFDAVLKGNQSTITAMAFSGDSKLLVSGADDGLIVLWDLNETSWRERACRMANRNLTKEEWIDYVGESTPFELLCPTTPNVDK
jgi:WD40 repeat protein